jgi:hypothetical protein
MRERKQQRPRRSHVLLELVDAVLVATVSSNSIA